MTRRLLLSSPCSLARPHCPPSPQKPRLFLRASSTSRSSPCHCGGQPPLFNVERSLFQHFSRPNPELCAFGASDSRHKLAISEQTSRPDLAIPHLPPALGCSFSVVTNTPRNTLPPPSCTGERRDGALDPQRFLPCLSDEASLQPLEVPASHLSVTDLTPSQTAIFLGLP